MKLTEYAIDNIKEFITGDNKLTPGLSGPKLVRLFNSLGARDVYGELGLPEQMSRNKYSADRMLKINNSKNLKILFEMVFSDRHFAASDKDLDKAVLEVNKIIKPEGYELIKNVSNIYKISSADPYDEDQNSEIHFEELESQLIDEINKAKYLIWIAVAWFTNSKLYDLLVEKRKLGLSIQAIILDDEINNRCGLHEKPRIYTFKAQPNGPFKNIMHNKFCIVDLKTVVHGSYNWTHKANYNNETLDIETNRENAEKFADEFMRIKKEISITP